MSAGFVFGAFIGYLSSASQVLQQQYGLGVKFPFYFGALALCIGLASFANSRLVVRFGMRRITTIALSVMAVSSIAFTGIAFWQAGHPAAVVADGLGDGDLWMFRNVDGQFQCIGDGTAGPYRRKSAPGW